MDTYNLLEEPWIEAIDNKGHVENYGIIELLLNADNLSEIIDNSPCFKYGMYRFLIVLITDIFKITEVEIIADLITQKKFSRKRIEQYANKHSERFWLFSDDSPFFQEPKLKDLKKTNYISTLIHHLPQGRNPYFFTHLYEDENSVSPAVCAKAILSFIPFGIGLGRSHKNKEGKFVPYTSGINKSPPYYFLIEGKNLFETLVLNSSYISKKIGPPFWKLKDLNYNKPKKTVSTLLGMTFFPRQLLLIPEEGGYCTYSGKQSNILVSKIKILQGLIFKEDEKMWRDPHVCYLNGKTLKPLLKKLLWQDFNTLLLLKKDKEESNGNEESHILPNHKENNNEPPYVIEQYKEMMDLFNLPFPDFLKLRVFGLFIDPEKAAKILNWVETSITFSLKIFTDPKLNHIVIEIIDLTKKIARLFGKIIFILIKNKDYNAHFKYWSRLDDEFKQLIYKLSSIDSSDKKDMDKLLENWKEKLIEVAESIIRSKMENPIVNKDKIRLLNYFYWEARNELSLKKKKSTFKLQKEPFLNYLEKIKKDNKKFILFELKNGYDEDPGKCIDMQPFLIPWVQNIKSPWKKKVFYFMAHIYAAYPLIGNKENEGKNLGLLFKEICEEKLNSSTFINIFKNILKSNPENLLERIKEGILIAKKFKFTLDYNELFFDLKRWPYESRFHPREKWAQSFWKISKENNKNNKNNKKKEVKT